MNQMKTKEKTLDKVVMMRNMKEKNNWKKAKQQKVAVKPSKKKKNEKIKLN